MYSKELGSGIDIAIDIVFSHRSIPIPIPIAIPIPMKVRPKGVTF